MSTQVILKFSIKIELELLWSGYNSIAKLPPMILQIM